MKNVAMLNVPRALIFSFALAAFHLNAADTRVLAGTWRFALDRSDAGVGERWFDQTLPDKIKLPGSLPEQGVGDPVTTNTTWTGGIVDRSWFTAPEFAKYREPGNVKGPFWLQPEKYYAGVAWFQREIEIPKDWQGKRIVLSLERPHRETRVWGDDRCVGTNNSLSTPHEYELGIVSGAAPSDTRRSMLAPGRHTVSIRVDNRRIVDIGENSHGITDHTQGNWNGIVGKIELRTTPLVWIEEVQVYPNVAKKSVWVVVTATNTTGRFFAGGLSLFFERGGKATRLPVSQRFNTTAGDLTTQDEVALGPDAPLWDEFTPTVQTLRAELRGELGGQPIESERTVSFGLRDISTAGTQFLINGRKTFIRGTLECCIFPKTGHPPTDLDSWRRIIRIAKAHGLNLIRFHSYCPPEAAFVAGDELGFYFQVETCWANQSTTLGDGKPVDRWVYDETDRILKYYGNHPSLLLMLYGNEPGGDRASAYLAKYVAHYRALDSRRLWSGGSGWPQLPENQFHVTPDPRIQGWGQELASRINAKPPETVTDYRDYIAARKVPVISHEIGQWCVYPNFDEMRKYTGHLKPRNFEIFRDTLKAQGMLDLARDFLLASGKLQTLCYKEDIESALRTPGMGGFELLDLHDFPGQGTALVGLLDPFWEEKGYVTAGEFSRFCNRTVPLARLPKRVFTSDEVLTAELEVAHFGAAPLKDVTPTYRLIGADGAVRFNGQLTLQDMPMGNGVRLGPLNLDLRGLPAPARYRLVVSLSGTPFANDWDIWVYPAEAPSRTLTDVRVTAEFDDAARAHLRAGGKLLLTLPGPQVRNFDTAPVKLGFSSIFWNTAWTGRQAPTTLGILCDPKHPALAEFPTDFHSNWQWWYLIHRAGALRLDLLPHGLKPIVRVIDDWVTARPLGLVVEGKVGAGKVVICGFDLTHDADDPVSRQMRTSLLDYMASREFAPRTDLTAGQIGSLIAAAK